MSVEVNTEANWKTYHDVGNLYPAVTIPLTVHPGQRHGVLPSKGVDCREARTRHFLSDHLISCGMDWPTLIETR